MTPERPAAMCLRTMAMVSMMLALGGSAACADDLTQLVVVVHTDLAPGADVDAIAVEIDATAAGGTMRRFEESLSGAGALRLPATLSVVSRDGTSGAVRVRAEALRGGVVVVSREAVVRFVRGESRTLKLDLLSCCAGVSCADGETCGEHGCGSTERSSVELPRWTGTAPPRASCDGADAGTDMGAADAGSDSGNDSGHDAGVSPCDPRHPPTRPEGEDDGVGGVRWYAFHILDFGEGGRFGEIGWDHDDLCTDLDSATFACESAPGFSPPADGPGGVDNAFAQSLVPLFQLFVPFFFEGASSDIDRGRFGFLMRVEGWNGQPDDPLVDVSLVDGVEGLRTGETLGDGGMVAEDARVPLPDGGSFTRSLAWDGTDRWYANRESFLDEDPAQALTRDRSAYVRDGLIVARTNRPAEFTISAVDVSLPLRLGAGTLMTARMSGDGARLTGGVIGGRWAVDDILEGVVTGFGICLGTPAYERTVDTLERVADLPTGDPGIGLRCDAVSVGVGFDAVEVELAGLTETARRLVDCHSLDAGLPDADTDADIDADTDGEVSFDGGVDDD